jgi:hypothetical protein
VGIWLAVGALPETASASELVARNTSNERLQVDGQGRALVTFHARGGAKHTLVWGAVDALHPSTSRRQVSFEVDYSGGWARFGVALWKNFRNVCGRYRGPALPWLVTACTAPDGSHWALQKWQRSQANRGLPPFKPGHGAKELRISHWTGGIANIDAWTDWSYSGRYHHIFGRLTYRDRPVYGFQTTRVGDPTDTYGRVLNLDTFDSAYGAGWRRENGFVSKRPDGTFCYGFVPYDGRPAGHGKRYRLATTGPGVTPDVSWEGKGLHDFRPANSADRAHEEQMNRLQRQLARGSKPCHP